MGKIHGISTPPYLLLCLSSSKNSSLWKRFENSRNSKIQNIEVITLWVCNSYLNILITEVHYALS